jgi:hypothetical protein
VSKHTPESFDQPMPSGETWIQCPNNGYDILIENGDLVGAFVHDDTHSKFSRARCALAVACVNACKGMSDPDKEIKAMRDVWKEAHDFVRGSEMSVAKLDAALSRFAALKAATDASGALSRAGGK